MQIEWRNIKDIKPYPRNAKEHTAKQIRKIADSIQNFGFNQPIVVDRNGVIVAGHGRYLAADSLKLTEVPVVAIDITEEKANAYRLADNKLNESEWLMDLVLPELKELPFELVELTGFDTNLVLETKEDDPPDLSHVGEPKTQLGDVYELGGHRLICGDSEKVETYEKLLGNERIRLTFTDPPYGINQDRMFNFSGKSHEAQVASGESRDYIVNDDKSPQEMRQFWKNVLKVIRDFSTDDATMFWWYAHQLVDFNIQALRDSGWHYSQTVVWLKNSFSYSPPKLFHRVYEPCMVGWKEGHSPYQNLTFTSFSELWTLDQKKFQDYLDMWYQKRDPSKKLVHPTQKPVQLAERALKRSSEKGDGVLDAFAGSGSTLIACEQLERRARLIELDPKYCDAIVTRWCKYKDDPSILKNGQQIQWTA